MKTLYLECAMGASGDMLMAALLELIPDPDSFIAEINALNIPGVTITKRPDVKCGITGTHVTVKCGDTEEISEDIHGHDNHGSEHDHCVHEHTHEHEHGHHEHTHEHEHGHHEHTHEHEHSHSGLHDIEHFVKDHLDLPDRIKNNILSVYKIIADAESAVHGVPADEIHFHEVGTMDAIADITGVCMLIDRISPARIAASPIHVGYGQVRCAHGILPVPAPATANILRGIPIYGGAVKGELCTPTGAALLKHFAADFGGMPVMKVSAVGCGTGNKNFEAANCLRAFLGEEADRSDDVDEIRCNLDDMTPEAVGFVQELLLEKGALDVYTQAIGMKKSRPGVMLCCMCSPDKTGFFAELILRHTSTLGVRISHERRIILPRTESSVETLYGPVRIKKAGDKYKYEYDDIARIAKENDLILREVLENLGNQK